MLRSQGEPRRHTNKNQPRDRRRFQIAIERVCRRKEKESASCVGGYLSTVRYRQRLEHPYGKCQNSRPYSEHFTAGKKKKNCQQYCQTSGSNSRTGKDRLCV